MHRIALITYDGDPSLTESDACLLPILREKRVEVTVTPWTAPIQWDQFSLIILRSAWDYHLRYPLFLSWIQQLESAKISLWNKPRTLRWNSNKTYLKKVTGRDIKVVPTIIVENIDAIPESLPWKEVIIKPAVGASSYGIKRFSNRSVHDWRPFIERQMANGTVIIQEYQPQIAQGECSFVFFDKVFSHAVLKIPAPKEFRVQSEYGGSITSIVPNESIILSLERLLTSFPDEMLYARVDGLFHNNDFLLMEIELCEPELFLANDPGASERFAAAILRRLANIS